MNMVNLELGRTIEGRKLYYPLDERSDNRSVLLMGRSGCGKSTVISLFEKQVIALGKRIIEVDFSDSSIADNSMGGYSRIINVKTSNSFSPLARHYNAYGMPESDPDFARRLADLITAAYRLGPRQQATLYGVIKDVAAEKNIISFADICKKLEKEEWSQSVLLKLLYFRDEHIFAASEGSDWRGIFSHPKPIQVLSLSAFPTSYRTVIAELLLMDLKNHLTQIGPENQDFVLVLDECQNLRLSADMPTAFFLSQGRKYGCGVWLATQSSGYFKREDLMLLYQPALTLNFQPNGDERLKICRKLSKNEKERTKLLEMFEKLQRGQFIATGRLLKADGTLSDYGHIFVDNIQADGVGIA